MITYSDLSAISYNQLQFVVHGDGTSTVLTINLAKQPFNLAFTGVLPTASVDTRNPVNPATAVITPNGVGEAMLAITFSVAPSAGVTIGPSVTFNYSSL